MVKPFFIMIPHPSGEYVIPMTDEYENTAMFASFEEATSKAMEHPTCQAWGYEIHKMGNECGEL